VGIPAKRESQTDLHAHRDRQRGPKYMQQQQRLSTRKIAKTLEKSDLFNTSGEKGHVL
jgi:hypothetical protein